MAMLYPYNMAIFKKKTISFLFLFLLKFQMEKDKIGKEGLHE